MARNPEVIYYALNQEKEDGDCWENINFNKKKEI